MESLYSSDEFRMYCFKVGGVRGVGPGGVWEWNVAGGKWASGGSLRVGVTAVRVPLQSGVEIRRS